MTERYPTNWERWLYQALCVVALLTLLIMITVIISRITLDPRRTTADCIRGGYLGYEQIGRTNVCVGIREDGVKVMETVSDVRERLGE